MNTVEDAPREPDWPPAEMPAQPPRAMAELPPLAQGQDMPLAGPDGAANLPPRLADSALAAANGAAALWPASRRDTAAGHVGLALAEPLIVAGSQSLNPLVGAAHPLLELASVLRQARALLPLAELRSQLSEMVRTFTDQCMHRGIKRETLNTARYCLCTFVDEVIAATPWGGAGAWASQSLLVTFHGEVAGGEHFFVMLEQLAHDSAANRDLLELLYLILTLGMEGRYRLLGGGRVELDRLRERLQQLIRDERGVPEPALSLHWQGIEVRQRGWWRLGLPAWVLLGAASIVLLLFLGLHAGLRMQRAQTTATLSPPVNLLPAPPALRPAPVYAPQLVSRLAPQIEQRLLSVDQMADRAVITLYTDQMFASGRSAPINARLLQDIGNVLRDVPGQVVVVGYTDNQLPGRGAPSNLQLSSARASRVVDLLREQAGHPERFLAQGRGVAEPIAPNDSAANQARNRRVVITVLAPGASL